MSDAVLSKIKVPRNLTAAMQLLQLYAQSGHVFWASDTIRPSNLSKFVGKLSGMGIDRSAVLRGYHKNKGAASVHLVVVEEGQLLRWILVSTSGKGGLNDALAYKPGTVLDLRLRGQHLRLRHYELLKQPKRWTDQERREHTAETLTWRMSPESVNAHQAFIVERAKQHDRAGLMKEVEAIRMQPLFAGVRSQVFRLQAEAVKVWHKFNKTAPELDANPDMPFMLRLAIYDEPPRTLLNIINPQ